MRIFKKILLVVLILFIAIQFIRPARNISNQPLPADITNTVVVPGKVLDVLQNACYDCHSNNTRYPWYMNIQPMGWIMAGHVKDGKKELNFSEFGNYSKRKQANKLKSVSSSIKDGSMPLSSYMIMHPGARLSDEEKSLLTAWVRTATEN